MAKSMAMRSQMRYGGKIAVKTKKEPVLKGKAKSMGAMLCGKGK